MKSGVEGKEGRRSRREGEKNSLPGGRKNEFPVMWKRRREEREGDPRYKEAPFFLSMDNSRNEKEEKAKKINEILDTEAISKLFNFVFPKRNRKKACLWHQAKKRYFRNKTKIL